MTRIVLEALLNCAVIYTVCSQDSRIACERLATLLS